MADLALIDNVTVVSARARGRGMAPSTSRSDGPQRMAVDVVTSHVIARPRAEVAAFAADPANATRWYENIRSVRWETDPPLAVGSRLRFEAAFLGRRLTYTYEILAYEPGEHLVMSTAEGPFAMETSYAWADAGDGRTRMTLRNRGEPAGFARVAAPLMERAMRHANNKDLARLKALLESARR